MGAGGTGCVSNQLISLASREGLGTLWHLAQSDHHVSNQLISLASREWKVIGKCGPNNQTWVVSNQLISLASRENRC